MRYFYIFLISFLFLFFSSCSTPAPENSQQNTANTFTVKVYLNSTVLATPQEGRYAYYRLLINTNPDYPTENLNLDTLTDIIEFSGGSFNRWHRVKDATAGSSLQEQWEFEGNFSGGIVNNNVIIFTFSLPDSYMNEMDKLQIIVQTKVSYDSNETLTAINTNSNYTFTSNTIDTTGEVFAPQSLVINTDNKLEYLFSDSAGDYNITGLLSNIEQYNSFDITKVEVLINK